LQATIAKLENELSNINEHTQAKENKDAKEIKHETMENLSVTDIVKKGIESERDRVPEQKDKNIVILNKSSVTMVVNDQNASQRIYTIQTGSFIKIERAQKQFDLIVKGLNEKELDYLRIEKIGKFYGVRLGKFISIAEAKIKLESVKSQEVAGFVRTGSFSLVECALSEDFEFNFNYDMFLNTSSC
jgi:cell division protein FtsN